MKDKYYKLKKEAYPFFKESYSRVIKLKQEWEEIGVNEKALEIYKECEVRIGVDVGNGKKTLSTWTRGDKSQFNLSLTISNTTNEEHKLIETFIDNELKDIIQLKLLKFIN